jgi:glyoxylase-like metal-dependent hydrolase (beta-lactamase superfamily II)
MVTLMEKQFGDVRVTIFEVCQLRADMADWFGLTSWPKKYDDLLHQVQALPVQCVLVQMPEITLLVDAYEYDLAPDFVLPDYVPPPSLLAQMRKMGVQPEDVTHVVITHLHFDHYTGVTREQDGVFVPTFPKAWVYIGRSDWQLAESQFAQPDSPESRTLALLEAHGLTELVAEEMDLGGGVMILPAPGESPGHQVVRVDTSEGRLYILGDLYHHEVEVEQPAWIVTWADAAGMTASRQALLPHLLDERAILVAAHIGGFGRLQQTEDGLVWRKV